MNYSLGNMLSRGGALNPDGLALDLQFAADKTLTARKGPTPTFTRASTATFVGSNGLIQTAEINTPRFDHDPVTLASRGLLIEESRTNLVTSSGNASTWASSSGTVTNNGSTTAPDGSSAGYLAGIGIANLNAPSTISVTGSYVASVFLKRNNSDWIRLQFVQGINANTANFWINLATGAAGTFATGAGTPTLISAQVSPFGNDWYRCSIAASFPATDVLSFSLISATANGSFTRVAGSVYAIWGGQIELGSFPTSYIPTTTASVVRSADVCSITGSDFSRFWNRFAGTCVIGAGSSQSAGGRFISNNLAARTLEIFGSQNINFVEISDINLVRIATSATYPNALCLAYAVNDYQSAYNGAISGSDNNTGGTIPNPSELHIGSLGGVSDRFTGHIGFIRYFKKRLPNAKLQSLTA
jgi:hypothetical protein